MISLVVLGLVGGFIITRFGESQKKAYIDAMRSDLRNYALAQELYFDNQQTFGEFPNLSGIGDFSLSEEVVVDSSAASSDRWYLRLGHERVEDVLCFMEGATGNQVIARRPACPGEDELEQPTAVISYQPDPAATLETITVDRYESSIPSGEILSTTWELPNGRTVEGDTARLSFDKSGEYEVTLTVEDAYRQTDETTASIFVVNRPPQMEFSWSPDPPESLSPVTFDASATEDLDGTVEGYQWDFGDENTGSGETVEHTYESSGKYDVQLVATDDEGRADTLVQQVSTTNTPPTADFTYSPDSATTTDEVTLDATSSSDADGNIVSYDWKLGDGTTATGDSVEHTYAEDELYDVELIVEDNQGDRDTLVDQVSIGNTLPDLNFTWSPENPATDTAVVFNASNSSDPDGTVEDYSWDFGDDESGSGVQPTHSYSDDGTYSITLTVTDNDGGPESLTKNIDVRNRSPTATFTFTPDTATTSDTVSFDATGSSDPDGSIDSYQWTFGDGNSGTGNSPEHSYADDGDYVVNLTITDDDGDSHGHSDTVTVENMPPTAEFSFEPDPATTLETVDFDAGDSEDTDGTISSYSWNFGDGETGTGQTPGHTYSDDGIYTTELIVQDDDGAADTITQSVEVQNRDPSAEFGFSPDPPRTQEQVSFDGTASGDEDGEIAGWEWDFGDGATASGDSTPQHTYEQDGNYPISLTVFDDDGAADTYQDTVEVQNRPPSAEFSLSPDPAKTAETVQLDASGSGDQDGSIQSYKWNFGDGNTAIGDSTTHAYTDNSDYVVELTVTDDDGDTSTHADTVTVENRPADVSFTFSPSPPQTETEVNFDGSSTTDPDGSINSFTWSFGDGSPTTSGDTAIHAYSDNGTYTVELTAMDDDGHTSTATQTVEVQNQAPDADFTFSPSEPQTSETVGFDGRTSLDTDGSVTSWSWDFGDGATATGSTPNHSYGDNDTYTVLLTITDDDGATDQISKSVTVTNRAPTSSFTYSPTNPTTGETVNFDGSGSSDADGSISSYNWDFGDGATATGATPGHAYSDDGTYTVSLTVTDDDGSTHTSSQDITVTNQSPSANFTYSPTEPTTNETASFDGGGASDPDGSISSYSWDFGNGNSGSGATPNHAYGDNGTYTVELTVTDDDGATNTTSQDITVTNQAPSASFSIGSQTIQTGESTTLSGNGSDPDGSISYYQWSIDGNTQTKTTSSNRNVSWSNNGSHTIDLRVQDDDGTWSSWAGSKTITVENQGPSVSLSCDDPANEGGTITCSANASDSDGSISSYSWGGAFSGTGSSSSRSFSNQGTYSVSVTVTDDDGATNSASGSVSVNNRTPNASASCNDPAFTNETITCSSTSGDPDGDNLSYSWGGTFGGTSSSSSRSFSDNGNYSVSLTVTDDNGASDTWSGTVSVGNRGPSVSMSCDDPALTNNDITCSASASDPDGSISSYSWGDSFSGTSSSSSRSFSDDGTYSVSVTVTDDDGATSSTSGSVTVNNRAPNSGLTYSCSDLSCSFTEFASDNDGTISSYHWDFGDGSTSTQVNPSHSYSSGGTYTVTLTVTDDDGAQDSHSESVSVTEPNSAPSVSISCPSSATTGETVTCTASGSDPDGDALSYSWSSDFSGTGTSSSETFSTTGTKTATVTVSDGNGGSDNASASISIEGSNSAPTADFSSSPSSTSVSNSKACQPWSLSSTSSDSDGSISSHSWSLSGGETLNPNSGSSTDYTVCDGSGTVTLTVTDDDGATDSHSVSFSHTSTF